MTTFDNWLFISPPNANGEKFQGQVLQHTDTTAVLYIETPVPHAEVIRAEDLVGFLLFPTGKELDEWLEFSKPKTDPEPDKVTDPKVTKLKTDK